MAGSEFSGIPSHKCFTVLSKTGSLTGKIPQDFNGILRRANVSAGYTAFAVMGRECLEFLP